MTRADLAVIGGGQLARMMQQPALALDVRLRLLAEAPDASAAQVIAVHIVGDYTDLACLREAVADAPVVTFDHEHVPPDHLRALRDAGHECRPSPEALLYAQDKLQMRTRLTLLDVPCPRWQQVESAPELESFAAEVGGFPLIVKTPRGGYDGKGVWLINSPADLPAGIFETGPLLAEEKVDFKRELSVLIARRPSGEVAIYPVVESRQVLGVCKEVIAPTPDLDADRANQAQRLAEIIATQPDVTGILAVELFETATGQILVNELAMRPHNTGHWTIDGADTSQFENHLRAVLDMPLGPVKPRSPWTVMVNILGGSVSDLARQRATVFAAEPQVRVHLYGKEVKPGRKVGHVTAYGTDLDRTLASARHAAMIFEGTA